MKMNRMSRGALFASLFSAGMLGAVACGSGDSDNVSNSGGSTDGEGGAAVSEPSDQTDALEEQIEALESQIEALEAALETAGADERAAIEDEISDLQDLIDQLQEPECGEGGDCVGLQEGADAIVPIIEALCANVFECCNQSQVSFEWGVAFSDEASCVSLLTARAEQGGNIDTDDLGVDLGVSIDIPDLAELADSIDVGAAIVDEDAVAACVAAISASSCGEGGDGDSSCSPSTVSLCDEDVLVLGQLNAGDPCNENADWNECGPGKVCAGEDGISACIALDGLPCVSNDDCRPEDNEFDEIAYCDFRTNTCRLEGDVGDPCEFRDPAFTTGGANPLLARCLDHLQCNPWTGTCEQDCTDGAACDSNGDCPSGSICVDEDDSRDGWDGRCGPDDRADDGATCDTDTDCKSDWCEDFDGVTDTCAVLCDDHGDCDAAEYCDGACYVDRTDGASCDDNEMCDTGLCIGGECQTAVTTGGDCSGPGSSEEQTALCPTGEYCDEGTCTALVALTGDCTDDGDLSCGPDAYCHLVSNTCVARVARGGDCYDGDGSGQDTGESAQQRGCMDGFICAGYNNGTDDVYVCVPGRDEERVRTEGEYCGRNAFAVSSVRCVTGRCRAAETGDAAFCEAGLPIGDACDAEDSWNAPPGIRHIIDPCVEGGFCMRSAPDSADDYSGTCTAKVPAGGLCDVTLPRWLRQCEGDRTCDTNNQLLQCPALSSEEDGGMCTLSDFRFDR